MNVKLKYPIKVEAHVDKPEYEIKELNLVDRMQAKHAEKIPDEAFSGNGVNPTRFIEVIAEMASIDLSVAKRLDFMDLVDIVGSVMMPFLGDMGLTPDQLEK